MADTFATSYCNQAHALATGRPVGHECYVLPPRALAAERAGDVELANQILASSNFKARGPVRGRRSPVVASLQDDRYEKPFRYLPKLGAYLVTLQDMTATRPGMYDVVPEHGDRVLPKGIIEKAKKSMLYHAFLYDPRYAGRYDMVHRLAEASTLDEAVMAIVNA
jgi:hypothetical protein